MKIELNNVQKIFDKKIIFDNASLKIQENDLIILIGENGCGKTTLLRIIAGLEKINKGTLKIDDKIIDSTNSKIKNISFVSQKRFLYKNLTVYKNLSFPLEIDNYNEEQIKNKINETIKIFNIEELLTKMPDSLSSGEKQKVIISKMLIKDNKIILMDEPFSNLDENSKKILQKIITNLINNGKTIVLVTHDIEQIKKFNNAKIFMIENKKIKETTI